MDAPAAATVPAVYRALAGPYHRHGAIILATDGAYWLDPAVALVIAIVVGFHSVRLLRKIAAALTGAPPCRLPVPPDR